MNKLFLNALLILIAVAVPGASAQGPGGVEGTAAWFRTEAVAGDSLYGWKDFSGADLRLTRGGTEPAAPLGRTSLFNFNRAIRLPLAADPADSTAASAVIRGHDLTQSTVCGVFIPMWLDPDTVHPDTPDGVLYTVLDGEGRITAAATDSVLVPAVPAAIGYSGPSAVPGYSAGLDVGSYNTNSIKIHTVHSVSHPGHGIWGTGDALLTVGGLRNGDTGLPDLPGAGRYGLFHGYIPELCVFPRVLSPKERVQVESYLAMRYGVTLQGSYLAADGALIWDAESLSSHRHRVTAICRDDADGFLQRTSATSHRPWRPFTGDEYTASSEIDRNHFLTIGAYEGGLIPDGTWLIWGDDGGSTAPEETAPPEDTTATGIAGLSAGWRRMPRTWRLNKHRDNRPAANADVEIEDIADRYTVSLLHASGPWSGYAARRTFLCIDRSGTGDFDTGTTDLVRCTAPDRRHAKTLFRGVEWDTDGNGSDMFTFAWWDGVAARVTATPSGCAGTRPLDDGVVTVEVLAGTPEYTCTLQAEAGGRYPVRSDFRDYIQTFQDSIHNIKGLAPGSYVLTLTQEGGSRVSGHGAAGTGTTRVYTLRPVEADTIRWNSAGTSGTYSVLVRGTSPEDGSSTDTYYGIEVSGYSVRCTDRTGDSGIKAVEGDLLELRRGSDGTWSCHVNGEPIGTAGTSIGTQAWLEIRLGPGESALNCLRTDGVPLRDFRVQGDAEVDNCGRATLRYEVTIGSDCDLTAVTEVRETTQLPDSPAFARGRSGGTAGEDTAGTGLSGAEADSALTAVREPGTPLRFRATLTLDRDVPATLTVYDASGRQVHTSEMPAGACKTDFFNVPAPGVYVVKAFTDGGEHTCKVIAR